MTRDELLAEAREAARHAYAPYSHFRVGAALLVDTPAGPRTVTGVNVENASYGLTLCAERAALAAALLVGGSSNPEPPRVRQVAIACIDTAPDAPDSRRTPCGACRQWLAELAPDAVYYVDGVADDLHLDDLLPRAFRLDTQPSASEPRKAPAQNQVARSPRNTGQRRKRE